jgi:hypothetical protein
MRQARIIVTVSLAAAVAVTGCTAHSASVHPAGTPTPASSTPPPTTLAPHPTPHPPKPAPASPRVRTPSRAAQRLLRAWQAGDRAAALRVASARAVDAVFARSPRSLHDPAFTGCATHTSGYDCAYSAGLSWLRLLVQGNATAGYRVQRAIVGDRITGPDTAATLLFQAWTADDYWAAQVWGGPKAARTLFTLPPDHYAFKGCRFTPPLGPYICKWEAERREISIYVAGGASVGYGIDKIETAPLPIA